MRKPICFIKNMTRSFLIIVVLCAASFSAYPAGPYECYQRGLFGLDLSVGSNFDLSSLNEEQKEVFEGRPSAVFQLTMRPSYYFSRHWGAYVDLSFSFFRFNDLERLVDVLMPGLSTLKPTLSIGGTYRYELGHWQIQPRLGVGIVEYGRRSTKIKTDGKEIIQKRTGGMWSVNAGVSAAYRTSRICSIFLDLSAMQPFTPAKFSKTTTVDGVTSRYKADSYSWGRNMSVSLGVRLQISGK